jgi:energy-coupling factor transporter ATP-binding protein EcfA2
MNNAMATIEIKNIGPIKGTGKFELNKINIFMGPQSSGKSTIAKIISHCYWYEKNYLLTGDEYYFYGGLIDFHRMDENYFSDDSEIIYESQWTKIVFRGKRKKSKIDIEKKPRQNSSIYQNLNIEYVPAERNFAATIPNLERYNGSFDNIINFLNDWMLFKGILTNNRKNFSSPLKSIDIKYKYNEIKKEDVLTLPDKKTILLQRASSGQQSITPLLVVCEYLFNELYNQKRNPSPAERKHIQDLLPENMKEDYNWVIDKQNFQQNGKQTKNTDAIEETKTKIWNEIGFSTDYHFASVIIEEPEQNLFPETQKELIYYLFESMQLDNRNHTLLLTTHSPYILYALNNCMMGFLVKDTMSNDEQEELPSKSSWINPKSVSVWEIEKGTIRPVKNNETGTVSKHYFNKIMNEVMEEYYDMLTYLKIDKHEG